MFLKRNLSSNKLPFQFATHGQFLLWPQWTQDNRCTIRFVSEPLLTKLTRSDNFFVGPKIFFFSSSLMCSVFLCWSRFIWNPPQPLFSLLSSAFYFCFGPGLTGTRPLSAFSDLMCSLLFCFGLGLSGTQHILCLLFSHVFFVFWFYCQLNWDPLRPLLILLPRILFLVVLVPA